MFDRDVVTQFYPRLKTFKSKELGVYWRGTIPLIDGAELEVVILQGERVQRRLSPLRP